jgi:fructose-specific phosphotransferase system IIC component
MNTFCSHLGLYAVIFVVALFIAGWLVIWYFRSHQEGAIPSDPQIVRLLVNLLIVGVFSVGLFMMVILGKVASWQLLCH